MLHFVWIVIAVVGQALGVGGSVVGFLWGLSSFSALALQHALSTGTDSALIVSPAVYAIGQLVPSVLGTEVSLSLLDIFVPLVSMS